MAANVLTTVMFVLQVVFMCCLCAAGTSAFTPYKIFSSKKAADSIFLLKFESHAQSRFRRQSSAETVTNSGTNGQTLPDESSQPVTTPYSNIDAKNSSTSSAASVAPKDSAVTPTVQSTDGLNDTSEKELFEDADIIHNDHNYYTSDFISDKFSEHWVELENAPKHETLSSGHRVAAVFSLKFNFRFYGHEVNNVTVATGGFLYMSPFLHQWLTATQYIAPLMANFDPSFSSDSNIYVQSEKNRFIVEWKDVVLKDQNTTGRFHFQAILNEDGSIKFVYKSIPFPVSRVSNEEHPVKVGLSDAYYNDTFIPASNIKRRTIYEYHKVVLPMSWVTTGKVIVLTPLLTCNLLTDCETCVKHIGVNFDCRWCSALDRCSDGLDWYRQHWDQKGCQNSSIDKCEITSQTMTPDRTSPSGTGGIFPSSRNPSTVLNISDSKAHMAECGDGKCDKQSEFPVAAVVVVILIICGLLAGLAGWVYYAYTHPTSRSGMWLMEHRPSQIKTKIKFWKSNSDASTKYKVESEA